MKIIGFILIIVVLIFGVNIYSCMAIYELPKRYMEQRSKSYYSQFMDVAAISGKRWRAGAFNCYYHKVHWSGNEKFVLEPSEKQGQDVLIIAGKKAWEPYLGARWVKGPLLERKPSFKAFRGDVGSCFAFGFGRKPDVFKTAENTDAWIVDVVSMYTIISNSSNTVERISVDLR